MGVIELSSSIKTPRDPQHPREDQLVSIVLPMFNDQDTVATSLRSLLNQSHKKIEIIVVDDGSTDRSAVIVSDLLKSNSELKMVSIQHGGTSKAKNAGFAYSKGDTILFAEGDALYAEDYVKKALEALSGDSKVGAVCVLGRPWRRRDTFVTRCIDAEQIIIHKMIELGQKKPYYAWVFTRRALERAGLYDDSLTQAEDKDLFERVKKAGFEVALVNGVHWGHGRSETTWEFISKCYDKGKRRIFYIAKNSLEFEFLKGVILLWAIVAVVPLALFRVVPDFVLVSLVAVGSIYRYYMVLSVGLKTTASMRILLALPVFQLLRYLSNAIGYSVGVFLLFRRRNPNASP